MKKIIKSAAFALIVTTACILAAACTNDDLNSPDPARTPLAITEIGIGGSNLNASPATRIATDPASGAQSWEEGDAIRVLATLKDGTQVPGATLNPDGTTTATSTYIYKVGSGWTQTPAAGETTLYVDDVQSVSRVETYGGRTQYDPATDYLMQADPGAGGNPSATAPATYTPGDNYRLNDLLADDSPVLGGSTNGSTGSGTNGSPARNSLSATLAHRRVDLVLRVADGAAAPSIHALPAGAYLLVTISGNRTITAWFAGKTKDEDSASPTAGREVSTFRALVEPEDVPGVKASSRVAADYSRAASDSRSNSAPTYSLPAGPHELGTLVYPGPTDAAAPDPSATPREKRLSAKYTLSATAATPLAAGDRIVITATFMDNLDQLTADNVKIAPFEDGNGPDGEHVVTGETAYGNGLQPLSPDVFNAERTTWVVSGGGTDETDALVLKNVRDALSRLDDTDPTNQGRIDLVLSDVGKLPKRADFIGALAGCVLLRSVSAPRVTEIEAYAFDNCTALTTVSLPSATGDIGEYAFYHCYALTTVSLPLATGNIGKYAFSSCYALTTLSLPKATGDIGDYAFYACRTLQTIDLSAITGSIGETAFTNCKALTAVSLPLATGSIGENAFNGCKALTAVSLPGMTGSIGDHAFRECENLQTLSLPAVKGSIGAYAFNGCSALTSVSLPLATGNIGENAFAMCMKLQTVNLKSITGSIGKDAFYSCSALTAVSLPLATGDIGDYTFYQCGKLQTIDLPAITGSIGESAFYECEKLQTVSLPAVTGNIGTSAFSGCKALTSLSLPAVKGSIGAYAFSNCIALPTVSLPLATGDIGEYAFYWCGKLQTIDLPAITGSIGEQAFINCAALTSLSLPLATGDIGEYAFIRCEKLTDISLPLITGYIGKEAFYGCKLLKEIDLPLAAGESDFMNDDGSGTIAPNAFYGCGELEKANLPLATGSIGEEAFYGCKKLKEIDLPKANYSIGQSAFESCKALTTVKLPGVEYHIGRRAFGSCESLTTVDLSGVTGDIEYEAFKGCAKLKTLSLPEASGYIGSSAFDVCISLQTLSLPKARRFDGSVFSRCGSLTSLDISGVTDVEDIPEDTFAQFDDKGTPQSPKCDLVLSAALYNDDTLVTSSAGGTKNTFRGLVWKSIKPAAAANAANQRPNR
ncbi:leucine-rich repeat protein [Bacteroides sp. GD17]|jgi:hypothetical protein|uniref:leucine-rich repeat protein n=1 Tax=Bacteroides sp. GD17 TaxID=3139826 RepID=UPI0025EC0D52|nr:leucine-rich repeat protein [uncultured Bacteroides sp.]